MGYRIVNRLEMETAARDLSEDEWLVFLRRQTAMEIGRWLERRGRLEQPIRVFTLKELEAIAGVATARWVVLNSLRLALARPKAKEFEFLLGG
jgi:hypothetical protein